MNDQDNQRRVVIIGGGFAGLFAARVLRRAPVRVTLIDRRPHHLFQPLLYQCSTGILSEGKIAVPLRDLLRKQKNADFVLAEVTGIDAARHEDHRACPGHPAPRLRLVRNGRFTDRSSAPRYIPIYLRKHHRTGVQLLRWLPRLR